MFRQRFRASPIAAAVSLALLLPCFASALPRVAVLPFANKTGDPRYDYIGAIADGLVQFDLSSGAGVELVDRLSLDAALKERELSLSAVAADPSRLGAAQLQSADYLLSGEYVLIGKDALFTLRLIDVATTRAAAFSEGGSSENAVHALAERVVERLTGKRLSFRGEGRGRSILSLRDETPGSVALHSPLIDARILFDGEFIGYTTGDRRKPYLIENVESGPHSISTDLGRDFGVVKLPEISFSPWSAQVDVPAGKRVVVTDESRHFNDILYRLRDLLSFDASFSSGRFYEERGFSFVDRDGLKRSGSISADLTVSPDGAGGAGAVTFTFGDERREAAVSFGSEKETEIREAIGLVSFVVAIDRRFDRFSVRFEAERTDVRQGMHRDQD